MTDTRRRRVAVIGGGACGIIAVKCCLDEQIEPVCFEATEDIGGLWRYNNKVEDKACVMKSTVINTSKEFMAFSDFPPPPNFPNYMHNTKLMEYFRSYCDHFGVIKHIRFRHKVKRVWKSHDHESSGRWEVEYENIETQGSTTETFDGVLVCSGHHADIYDPDFEGLEKFKGQVLHTKTYKTSEGFEDKRILVIGIGNSGGDIAVELGRSASQVFVAVRSGFWLLHRLGLKGMPIDITGGMNRALAPWFHTWPARRFTRKTVEHLFDHEMYGVKPKHGVFDGHPTVNDALPNSLMSGAVVLKPNVRRFYETGVEFEDGTKEEIDVVFKATGYTFGFPFLDESLLKVEQNKVEMFKYMYPPHLLHNTLAVIGCVQPIGAINPLAELQCRLATRVIKGLVQLPSVEVMLEDIRMKEETMAKRYYKSQRHTIQVDHLIYANEVASLVGCKPHFFSLLMKDPKLAMAVFFGPPTPYGFRVSGPGIWDGARQAILTQMDRVKAPLRTRLPDHVDSKSPFRNFVIYGILLYVILHYLSLI